MTVLARFGIERAGSTAGREVVAGISTFATLCYILFVQPAILSACGMDAGGVLFATCVASACACFLMGIAGNHPIALAPAMGHNVFFAFTVCGAMGFAWREALAANLIAGLVFVGVARFGLRERVMHALPKSLQSAIAAGIGLLIALVGLEWAGIVVDHPATYVTLGELGRPETLLAIFGLALTGILMARRVRAALLIGMATTALVGAFGAGLFGASEPLVHASGLVGAPPSPVGTAFELDFGALFARPAAEWLAVIAVFLMLDLFDTIGTLLGVARRAGLLVDGRLPRARRALFADAAGTVVGAALGTSTVTSYVESAAGVEAGGRTGLTAIVCGVLFLAALFLAPGIEALGAGVEVVLADGTTAVRHPVLAPALILVGALMAGALRDVDWDDVPSAISAFLCVAMTPLTFSIAEGLSWGSIAFVVLSTATGRAARVPIALWICTLLFVLRYLLLP